MLTLPCPPTRHPSAAAGSLHLWRGDRHSPAAAVIAVDSPTQLYLVLANLPELGPPFPAGWGEGAAVRVRGSRCAYPVGGRGPGSPVTEDFKLAPWGHQKQQGSHAAGPASEQQINRPVHGACPLPCLVLPPLMAALPSTPPGAGCMQGAWRGTELGPSGSAWRAVHHLPCTPPPVATRAPES